MNQSELKELRSKLLRVKHKTGCTLDECIDYVDKRIKPDKPITYCGECKHFINKITTQRGCLRGICELSTADEYGWRYGKHRRRADQRKCRKFEKLKGDTEKKYEAKAITRGNCMMCGKELTEGLFFCKECEAKDIQGENK